MPRPRTVCPGGCGGLVRAPMIACRDDWYRLPEAMRAKVLAEFTPKSDPTAAYREAVADALAWFGANPRPAPEAPAAELAEEAEGAPADV